ncbi:sensor histidine kinase [Ornithinibacillus halophilus]|uniref:histidine kinase n=1 Tax=Ornithinibacillus halophilus TaxID=930117 RepID=A0A1M5NND7_9BACI|nr:sensor histidine kinase [Ornithinibacillus halophilus]SHG91008.1 two-component system, NarL family, sensor histidine kinase DesK [Ornithinibacillus halophilus]
MQKWYQIFSKNTGLSIYAWIIFCLLPFYFIISSSTPIEIIIGVLMIMLFFTTYRLSFIKKGWTVYVSVGIEIAINIGMTLYFGYVYFALFLAFFIGNIANKSGFITLYVVHLVTSIAAVTVGFFTQSEAYFSQLPFIIITVIGVILLPFNMYNRNKRDLLENQLENANKKISQLMVMEERERIARDLHDTLGQKLSLIGLKSDLAEKLVHRNPTKAIQEIHDINQTARTALNEVREMVSNMKSTKLEDEIVRIKEVIKAAEIDFKLKGTPVLTNTPLLVENVLSMCLKEAITNVVNHSQATRCSIWIAQSDSEVRISVDDNGIGMKEESDSIESNGIQGMRERLEFVNGDLQIESKNGTTLIIQVPKIVQQSTNVNQEGLV